MRADLGGGVGVKRSSCECNEVMITSTGFKVLEVLR